MLAHERLVCKSPQATIRSRLDGRIPSNDLPKGQLDDLPESSNDPQKVGLKIRRTLKRSSGIHLMTGYLSSCSRLVRTSRLDDSSNHSNDLEQSVCWTAHFLLRLHATSLALCHLARAFHQKHSCLRMTTWLSTQALPLCSCQGTNQEPLP